MATKVQAKAYFPGSVMDLNKGLCNGTWDPYHDDISRGYNFFLTRQTMDGYPGYPKEQMRQTILKQEMVFRHQLQELHRLYNRQKALMNELAMKEAPNSGHFTVRVEAPNSGHFSSQVCSRVSKEMHTYRREIDLELPADVEEDSEAKQQVKIVHNLGTKRAYNLADLNEVIQMGETSFEASLINKNSDCSVTEKLQKQGLPTNSNSGFWYLQADLKKAPENVSRKRTIFGVELCESIHKPSFDSSQSFSCTQNASSFSHNHWIGSSNASIKIQENFAGNRPANNSNSRLLTSCTDSKISFSDIVQESHEKHDVLDGGKNHQNLEKQLPSWLMKIKGKETTLCHMNLDSLQHHSQQFFKKAEKVQTDDCHGITKILGVPIMKAPDYKDSANYSHAENGKNSCILESRHEIDLNLSFDEEEDPSPTPHIPEPVLKIASMNIDLEAPAALETETDDVFMDADVEVVKSAAEAIISIANQPPLQEAPPAADTLLRWFAAVIASSDNVRKDSVNDEESIPQGMDYFEYMTLKLQETKEEYHSYKAEIVEEKEEEEVSLRIQTPRKGRGKRGRQRKDFQRDVLPGIVSLSRREVSEDLQTFEEAFTCIGVSWRSKKKAGGKNGRGRRRLVVSTPSSPTSPPPPPTAPVVAVEQSVCREVALEEKSLSGWGKRTRRLPRQRCQNGGNHHSLALQC